ncbi:hypothetical protein [Haloparvum sp. AD34]
MSLTNASETDLRGLVEDLENQGVFAPVRPKRGTTGSTRPT